MVSLLVFIFYFPLVASAVGVSERESQCGGIEVCVLKALSRESFSSRIAYAASASRVFEEAMDVWGVVRIILEENWHRIANHMSGYVCCGHVALWLQVAVLLANTIYRPALQRLVEDGSAEDAQKDWSSLDGLRSIFGLPKATCRHRKQIVNVA